MNTKLKSVFFGLFLFSTPNLLAVDCRDPFEGVNKKKFILQEKLDCNNYSNQLKLRISSASQTQFKELRNSSYFLEAECVDNTKVLNLKHNASEGHFVNWSDKIGDDEDVFNIQRTCVNENLGRLDNNLNYLVLENNEKVTVSIAAFKNDSLIFYVLAEEEEANDIIFRSPTGKIMAMASRSFGEDSPNQCYANWLVDNEGGIDPTLLSYAIAWKDNDSFECGDGTPKHSMALSVKSGVIIGVATFGFSAFSSSPLSQMALSKSSENALRTPTNSFSSAFIELFARKLFESVSTTMVPLSWPKFLHSIRITRA